MDFKIKPENFAFIWFDFPDISFFYLFGAGAIFINVSSIFIDTKVIHSGFQKTTGQIFPDR